MLHNWPCVLWSYAVSLAFGLLAGLPFSAGLAPYLDHSLASQQISGSLDAGYLVELALRLHRDHGIYTSSETALWLTLFEFFAILILVAGTISIYVGGEPAGLSVLLRQGAQYFWRFVRALLFGALTAGPILGLLLAARAALLDRLSDGVFERKLFLYASISAAVVLLVALPLRLWLDLVEVYTVRNGIVGNPRVRLALLPALRLLMQNFWRLFSGFLLAAIAGSCALVGCLLLWKEFVPANLTWLACLVSQVGLFLLLASRFWHRGMEVALVLAVEPPVTTIGDPVKEVPAPVPPPPAEPTLQELVMKLRNEPWARPDAVPANSALFPEAPAPVETRPPQDELLAEHERKVRLPKPFPKKEHSQSENGAQPAATPENQAPGREPTND